MKHYIPNQGRDIAENMNKHDLKGAGFGHDSEGEKPVFLHGGTIMDCSRSELLNKASTDIGFRELNKQLPL